MLLLLLLLLQRPDLRTFFWAMSFIKDSATASNC